MLFNKLTKYDLLYIILIVGGRVKKLKVVFLFSLLVILIIPYRGVNATTLRDLYNDLSSLESSYNEAKEKANISAQELESVRASISTTEAEIEQAQEDIVKAEEDIVVSEQKIEDKKDETNQMLLTLQLSNTQGNSMLEYIFDASDYTDMIYRYSVVTQMSDYNLAIMDELNALIDELNTKKENLAREQEELAVKKEELQAQYLIVQTQYKDATDDSLDVATQISEMRQLINMYESMGCSMDQDVNTCNGIAAVDGWTYPLRSFYQSSNYGWDENRYHYAVDLAVSEGTNVYAVANGEVISSGVYWSSAVSGASCGGYVIQIKHNYNGSWYVSLYMHLLTGYVSVGDKVTGGQVIGTSGGGSQEVAKWNDICTAGAHLHFAMANGDTHIGSSSSKGSTIDPVRFFPAMQGIGSTY